MPANPKKPGKKSSSGSSRRGRSLRASPSSASELRARLELTRPVFARLLGVSERTVASWERTAAPKSGKDRPLQELRSVIQACERVMKPEFVGQWLVTPVESLGDFKPIELIERGETERVLRALFRVESGIPL
jgi:DNA-binding transcriptional regulator YiaG